MDAVWNLEDKWRLSTKQALFLLLFAASGIVGVCVATTMTLLRRLKSRRTKSPLQKQQLIIDVMEDWPPPEDPKCGWAAIKRKLMSSLRWSQASKWRPRESCTMMSTTAGSSWRETPLPLLMEKEMMRSEFHSHDSESPVWQRPILMGEKCELPRFSGLILYDENGQLLCDVTPKETSCKITIDQEKSTATVVRKTLRDLL